MSFYIAILSNVQCTKPTLSAPFDASFTRQALTHGSRRNGLNCYRSGAAENLFVASGLTP